MTPKRFLDWNEFDHAVGVITDRVRQSGAIVMSVCGLPRGGLPLAVALSHRLGVPLVPTIGPGVLVVDDVFETGVTMAPLAEHPLPLKWVWACKHPSPSVNFVTSFDPKEWLVFPWESSYSVDHDARLYYASRQ